MRLETNTVKVVKNCTLSVEGSTLKISRTKGDSPEFTLVPGCSARLAYYLGELAQANLTNMSVSVRGDDLIVIAPNGRTHAVRIADTFTDPTAVKVTVLGLPPTTEKLEEWYRHERQVQGAEPRGISRIAEVRQRYAATAATVEKSLEGFQEIAPDWRVALPKAVAALKTVWPKAGPALAAHYYSCMALRAFLNVKADLVTSILAPEPEPNIPIIIPIDTGFGEPQISNAFGLALSEPKLLELFLTLSTVLFSRTQVPKLSDNDFVVSMIEIVETQLGLRDHQRIGQQSLTGWLCDYHVFELGGERGGPYSLNDIVVQSRANARFRWTQAAVLLFFENDGDWIAPSNFCSTMERFLFHDVEALRKPALEAVKPKLSISAPLGYIDLYKVAYRGGEEILSLHKTKLSIAQALVNSYGSIDAGIAEATHHVAKYIDDGNTLKNTPDTPEYIVQNNQRLLAQWKYLLDCLNTAKTAPEFR